MSEAAGMARQEWMRRGERGAALLLEVIVWIALRLGRPTARLLLYPICFYFLLFTAKSRRASQDYLSRVLRHAAGPRQVWRHYRAFAACILDRVFLLNDRIDLFDLDVHGEEIVSEILHCGGGCFLLGAHLGSFEVLLALGRRQPNLRVSLAMYEDNARKINAVLGAINPALALEIIALGESGSMLEVAARLDAAHFVGMLADRGLSTEGQLRLPFLGSPAQFPIGPFRMAAILKRPVVLMLGLYRGGRQYEIHFERLAGPEDFAQGGSAPTVEAMMQLYVARLEHHCRSAPYNWFNFYDFWN